MSRVRRQRLHPAFIANPLHGQPITPEQVAQENPNGVSLLNALKAKSGPSSVVLPHALSTEALENEHDQQHPDCSDHEHRPSSYQRRGRCAL